MNHILCIFPLVGTMNTSINLHAVLGDPLDVFGIEKTSCVTTDLSKLRKDTMN
jgi:hypothetical protein